MERVTVATPSFMSVPLRNDSTAAQWRSRHAEHGGDQGGLPQHKVVGGQLCVCEGLSAH